MQSGRSSRDDGREGDEVQDSEADIEATGGRKHPGDGAGADRDHDSKLDKLKHKLWDMFLTLIGSFFGTVFLALGSSLPSSSLPPPPNSPTSRTASRALYLSRHNAPIVIGSFGAEGVLLYAAHDSPLTQPRNVVFGNTISAVLGVCVAKLFSKLEGFMVGEVFGVNWACVFSPHPSYRARQHHPSTSSLSGTLLRAVHRFLLPLSPMLLILSLTAPPVSLFPSPSSSCNSSKSPTLLEAPLLSWCDSFPSFVTSVSTMY